MKLSGDAVKRILLIVVIGAMFQVYETAKKHAADKPNTPIKLTYVPKDPKAQQKWLESQYKKQLAVCAPTAKPIAETNLTRLANFYQEQLELVKTEYPNADLASQKVVAQNYFSTKLSSVVINFTKYYNKDNADSFNEINYINSLKNNSNTGLFIASIHQFGDEFNAQKDTFNSIVNNADVAKIDQLLETKYGLNPSVQIAKYLFINQHSELDDINAIKESCFTILEHYPSLLKYKVSR